MHPVNSKEHFAAINKSMKKKGWKPIGISEYDCALVLCCFCLCLVADNSPSSTFYDLYCMPESKTDMMPTVMHAAIDCDAAKDVQNNIKSSLHRIQFSVGEKIVLELPVGSTNNPFIKKWWILHYLPLTRFVQKKKKLKWRVTGHTASDPEIICKMKVFGEWVVTVLNVMIIAYLLILFYSFSFHSPTVSQ